MRFKYSHARARFVPRPRRLEVEEVADHAEDVSPPLPRGHVHLDVIGEDQGADAVVVLDGAEGEERGDLGGELAS